MEQQQMEQHPEQQLEQQLEQQVEQQAEQQVEQVCCVHAPGVASRSPDGCRLFMCPLFPWGMASLLPGLLPLFFLCLVV